MPQGQPQRRPARRAHHPAAPQPAAGRGAHRRRQGEVHGRLRAGPARLEPGLVDRGLPVREVRQVAPRGADRLRAPAARRGHRPGRHRVAQDGLGLVLVAQAGRRGGPRRAPRPRAGPRSSGGSPPSSTTCYILDEFTYPVNWGWVDVDDVVETLAHRPGPPARGHHRPPRRPEAGRGRRPGHRDDQGQAPDGRRARRASGGSSGERACTALPRLVIAAPASGHGKTTVATGLMAALRARRARGVRPQGRPGLHRPRLPRAGHRPSRAQPRPAPGRRGPAAPAAAARRSHAGAADVAVVEGVMGLYDGALGTDGFASTAHVAAVARRPGGAGRRHLARLPLHRRARARDGHLRRLGPDRRGGAQQGRLAAARRRGAVPPSRTSGCPVLGRAAPRRRHLGALPPPRAGARRRASRRRGARWPAGRAGRRARRRDAVLALARGAPDLDGRALGPRRGPRWRRRRRSTDDEPGGGDRGRAGLHVPLRRDRGAAARRRLPDRGLRPDHATGRCPTAPPAIYLGGGFPEVHAASLGAQHGHAAPRSATPSAAGMPTVAECAGPALPVPHRRRRRRWSGAVDAAGAMTPGLTLGYRTATGARRRLLTRAGERVTGHEFHRTTVCPVLRRVPDLDDGAAPRPSGRLRRARACTRRTCTRTGPGSPAPGAARFAELSRRTPYGRRSRPRGRRGPAPPRRPRGGPGAGRPGRQRARRPPAGLAATTRCARPWRTSAPTRTPLRPGTRWPGGTAVRRRRGAAHRRRRGGVHPGGPAAALARTRSWCTRSSPSPRRPCAAAGHDVQPGAAAGRGRLPARPRAGADRGRPGGGRQPDQPDRGAAPAGRPAVACSRPGRVVVVDEAFMDAVPGEPESLTGRRRTTGLLVLRSLTKTWSLPGVRAGYVVGDPALVAALAEQQPPWSVSTTADGRDGAPAARRRPRRRRTAGPRRSSAWRAVLVTALAEAGLEVAGDPVTPVRARPRTGRPAGAAARGRASPSAAATPSPGSARAGCGSPCATAPPRPRWPGPWAGCSCGPEWGGRSGCCWGTPRTGCSAIPPASTPWLRSAGSRRPPSAGPTPTAGRRARPTRCCWSGARCWPDGGCREQTCDGRAVHLDRARRPLAGPGGPGRARPPGAAATCPPPASRSPTWSGRDPSVLGPDEIARATVESVAENTADAVVAPLLWGAVAGPAGLLGYRAANTLDAMVGHRSPRYERFGWASARLDDVAQPGPRPGLRPAHRARLPRDGRAPRCGRGGATRTSTPAPTRGRWRRPSPAPWACGWAAPTCTATTCEDRGYLGDGPAPGPADITRAVALADRVGLAALGRGRSRSQRTAPSTSLTCSTPSGGRGAARPPRRPGPARRPRRAWRGSGRRRSPWSPAPRSSAPAASCRSPRAS